MKEVLTVACVSLLAFSTSLAADHRSPKAEYEARTLMRGVPAPKAGTDDCTDPTEVGSPLPYSDNGDTTGATSTVNSIPISCNGFYTTVPGPDHIYMFTVGASNDLTLTATPSNNDYDTSIYVLGTCGDGSTCVGGSDYCFAVNTLGNPCGQDAAETVSLSGLAAGTYYFYVDSIYAPGSTNNRDSGPYTVAISGTLPVRLIEFEID